MTKPRVVHLTSVHDAFDTRVLHRECRSLVGAGYDVRLIGRTRARSERHGVEIFPFPHFDSRVGRVVVGGPLMLVRALRQDASIFHLHDPELIPVGILLRLAGKKVILDLHEEVTKQVLQKSWIPGAMRRIVSRGLSLGLRASARFFEVVVAEPVIAEMIPGRRCTIVQNFPSRYDLDVPEGDPIEERGRVLCYVGTVSVPRGILDMLDALVLLNETAPTTLNLVGRFPEEGLLERCRRHPGWRAVRYHGWKDREEVAEILSESTIGVVVLHRTAKYVSAWPTKLFEYMMAELPVVASNFPLWKGIVDDAGCGVIVEPEDPEALAAATEALFASDRLGEMGKRGARRVREKYVWEHEFRKLADVYDRLS